MKKKPRQLGPPPASPPEQTTISTAAVHGVVAIRFSRQVGSLEMSPEEAKQFAEGVVARAQEAFVQRLQIELAQAKARVAELEKPKSNQQKPGVTTQDPA